VKAAPQVGITWKKRNSRVAGPGAATFKDPVTFKWV
jgi:hypothetical protein